jgi:hypothetical protein
MTHYRYPLIMILLCFLAGSILAGYYLWYRNNEQSFSCLANLEKHHPDEKLSLWLNYIFSGNSGSLSINGWVHSEPKKNINRKIFFQVERKDHVFLLTSVRHMKFPGDNVSDDWLEKYEPEFFIHPNKSIYILINEQQNGNYIFMLGTLPTYVCYISKKEKVLHLVNKVRVK